MRRRLFLFVVLVSANGLATTEARADDAGTTSLTATDFTFTLAGVDGAGHATPLTTDQVATYFSVARCACPTNVLATLTLGATAAANLGTHVVDAQLVVGSDCDDSAATGCTTVGGTLTLASNKTSTNASVGTSSIFAAAGRASCAATTSSTRLWAIVRLDGTRLSSEPSLALTLGGAGPKAPTAVKAQSADSGLLVSWTASGDATTLRGHQVLCSPGPATAATASYDTCGTAAPQGDAGADPFATLDAQFVCSGLVGVGTNSVRVHGLQNGRAYQLAVVAVGIDGTPSTPSNVAEGTPAPTVGFTELYEAGGGTAAGGCAVGGAARPHAGVVFAALALALVLRRRRRRSSVRRSVTWMLVLVVVTGVVERQARAELEVDDDVGPSPLTLSDDARALASPRSWNLELRFGPYRPDVDSEFADRGQSARPFAQLFSSSSRLMMQLEIDRQLLHRAGTWSVGLGVGYYKASAAALAADLTTPSGDETALRLIPLSAALVYRADWLRARYGSPLVPYGKLGLDCTLWHASDTSQASTDGRTFGWHAAAGLSLDLASLDPEAARAMDRESGVNQTAVFFEVARYSLDGFGSGSVLHVGDTTWFGGLMLEF
jgi:MYXO-CTERM domain-containing protein